jgi:GlpG protein
MHSPPDLISHWRRVPITVLVLTLSGVVLVLMEVLGEAVVLDWLAFNKVEYNGRRFELVSPGTDYWRYVSPALVHFGVMHIVFNALWIWEFGSRLELRLGSIFVLNLFLAGAVGGNLLQYWWAGPSIFGGLSGVVYAYMGCLWILWRLRPGTCVHSSPLYFYLHVDMVARRIYRCTKVLRALGRSPMAHIWVGYW